MAGGLSERGEGRHPHVLDVPQGVVRNDEDEGGERGAVEYLSLNEDAEGDEPAHGQDHDHGEAEADVEVRGQAVLAAVPLAVPLHVGLGETELEQPVHEAHDGESVPHLPPDGVAHVQRDELEGDEPEEGAHDGVGEVQQGLASQHVGHEGSWSV